MTKGYLLSHRELEALEEIARWSGSPFRWKQDSMRKLAVRGMVRRCAEGGTDAFPAWVITEAGREHLRGFPA